MAVGCLGNEHVTTLVTAKVTNGLAGCKHVSSYRFLHAIDPLLIINFLSLSILSVVDILIVVDRFLSCHYVP